MLKDLKYSDYKKANFPQINLVKKFGEKITHFDWLKNFEILKFNETLTTFNFYCTNKIWMLFNLLFNQRKLLINFSINFIFTIFFLL